MSNNSSFMQDRVDSLCHQHTVTIRSKYFTVYNYKQSCSTADEGYRTSQANALLQQFTQTSLSQNTLQVRENRAGRKASVCMAILVLCVSLTDCLSNYGASLNISNNQSKTEVRGGVATTCKFNTLPSYPLTMQQTKRKSKAKIICSNFCIAQN